MTELLALALLAIVMATVGRAVLGRLQLQCTQAVERIALSLGLGWMLVSMAMCLLGALGMYRLTIVGGTFVIAGILMAPAIGLVFDDAVLVLRSMSRAAGLGRPALGFGVIVTLFAVVYAFTPSTNLDESVYHYLVPRLYAQAGGIVPRPDLFQASSMPMAAEMPLVMAFLMDGPDFNGEILANLLRPLTVLFMLSAGISLSLRFYSRSTARLFSVVALSAPCALLFLRAFSVDALGAGFLLLAVYCLMRWMDAGQRRWLAMAGVLCGFFAGMKHTGLPAVLAMGAIIVLFRPNPSRRPRTRLQAAFLFSAWVLVAAFPWYLRNAVFSGDPFFPYLLAGTANRPELIADPGLVQRAASALDPSRLWGYLSAVFVGHPEYQELRFGMLGFALLPLVFLLRPFDRRVAVPVILAGTGLAFLYVFTWPQPRYFFPFWCVLMVPACDAAIRLLGRSRLVGVAVALLLAGQCALALGLEAPRVWKHVQVLLGDESPDEFRRLHEMPIRSVRWLNAQEKARDRVLAFSNRLLAMDMDFLKFEDGYFSPADLREDRFRALLNRRGITYVLYDSVYMRHGAQRRISGGGLERSLAALEKEGVLQRIEEASDAIGPATFIVYAVTAEKPESESGQAPEKTERLKPPGAGP